jgi:hypothetical protein
MDMHIHFLLFINIKVKMSTKYEILGVNSNGMADMDKTPQYGLKI